MKRMLLLPVLTVLALLMGTALHADSHAKPMTDDDVAAMVKAGLPDDTIISAINSQATDFDVSAQALVSLKNQGVSVKVIDAMLASLKRHGAPDHPASPTGSGSDLAPSPASPGQPSANASGPAAVNNSDGQSSTVTGSATQSSGGQHAGFFDRVNQTQNQLTGTIQQGQTNYQQIRAGMPGHQNPNAVGRQGQASGAYSGAPAATGQPAAPAYPAANQPTTNPNPPVTNQPPARTRYPQPQRALAAQPNAAQMQQQRQQQVAAAHVRAAKQQSCMTQARKDYPRGGPDLAKAYQACVQTP